MGWTLSLLYFNNVKSKDIFSKLYPLFHEVQWKNCNGDVVSPIGSPFTNIELISAIAVKTETSCNLVLTTADDRAIDIFNIPSTCTLTTILTFEGNDFSHFTTYAIFAKKIVEFYFRFDRNHEFLCHLMSSTLRCEFQEFKSSQISYVFFFAQIQNL